MIYNKSSDRCDEMEKLAIGIMSGTSLDGIDVAIAKIQGSFTQTQIEPIAFETFPFEGNILKHIKKAISSNESSSELLCSLNFELGEAFADAVIRACEIHGILLDDLDFIASHGQTIYHIAHTKGELIRSSLQLGEGSVIAERTQATVVSNFRAADIAAGGQGAPLVPYADYILFRSSKFNRSIHNIGGISNMTILPKDCLLKDVSAFDTGPGVMMINYVCKSLFGFEYDLNGSIARKGTPIKKMLDELMQMDYLKANPPKSTGRELFGDQMTSQLIKTYESNLKEDIVSTFTHFTANSIVKAYQDYVLPKTHIDEIIFCGGGSKNIYLIELIQKKLNHIKISQLEDYGFDSQAKEALAFLILGNETLNMNPSNVIGATGAHKNAILGQINYYFKV